MDFSSVTAPDPLVILSSIRIFQAIYIYSDDAPISICSPEHFPKLQTYLKGSYSALFIFVLLTNSQCSENVQLKYLPAPSCLGSCRCLTVKNGCSGDSGNSDSQINYVTHLKGMHERGPAEFFRVLCSKIFE